MRFLLGRFFIVLGNICNIRDKYCCFDFKSEGINYFHLLRCGNKIKHDAEFRHSTRNASNAKWKVRSGV